ncbi:MAG: NUDIX hydrolase [Rhizobiaceae bacterium]
MHRIGIIPFDVKGDTIALLFVTSQTRGRWILPKGLGENGESHAETGAREGFEEAGIRGNILPDFPITIPITKTSEKDLGAVPVTYYPFHVTEQIDDWPEADKRQRHWALLKDAAKVVHREDFLALINQFSALSPWILKSISKETSAKKK